MTKNTILREHFKLHEELLFSQWKISQNAKHPTLIGDAREFFISEILKNHLPKNIEIGSGMITHSGESLENRNNFQHDIILYDMSYPKIHLGGGTICYLIEGVIATIEVKSILDSKAMTQAVKAASFLKKNSILRKKNESWDEWKPRKPLSFIFAYSGYKGKDPLSKTFNLFEKESISLGINPTYSNWDDLINPEIGMRNISTNGIDGISILKQGFIGANNTRITASANDSDLYYQKNGESLLPLFLNIWSTSGINMNFEGYFK